MKSSNFRCMQAAFSSFNGILNAVFVHIHKPYLLPKPLETSKPLPQFSSVPSSKGPGVLSSARVYKLIISQKDPLLALEIFEVASQQPGFKHSYSSYHALICKLGRAGHFKAMEDLLRQMRKEGYSYTPGLFSDMIGIYGEFGMPNQALKTFYQMLEFGCKPLAKHLNVALGVLIQHKQIETALTLFTESGIAPSTKTYNILMRAQCHSDKLSHAYALFNQMRKQGCIPDVETYSILMQGLCRKSQVKTAVSVLEEMLNKGYIPNALTYTTLLNSLCRKRKLREAHKLLNRMKVMGCNPDVVNYNTIITGYCREWRALEACEVLREMPSNGCLPNALSYRTVVNGLCEEGRFSEAKELLDEMLSKGFSQHISTFHALITGFCKEDKVDEACAVLQTVVEQFLAPHDSTWHVLLRVVCEDSQTKAKELVDQLCADDSGIISKLM